MRTRLFVTNFGEGITKEDLVDLFSHHGIVTKVEILVDRETGLSRGWGFVEMRDAENAECAIEALDGSWFQGRRVKVNKAPN